MMARRLNALEQGGDFPAQFGVALWRIVRNAVSEIDHRVWPVCIYLFDETLEQTECRRTLLCVEVVAVMDVPDNRQSQRHDTLLSIELISICRGHGDKAVVKNPANSAPFAHFQEISDVV